MPELKEILEALIFVNRGVLSVKDMKGVLKEEYPDDEIRRALDELQDDYARRGGAITLTEVAEGFEFVTRSDLAEWIGKMDHFQHHRHLSRPALETLAIISYKQPVTRPEIEALRGVNVDRILRNLLDKKLIRILGRKDVPGKPIVYGTSREFLVYFGLRSLADLPSLKEFVGKELPEESETGQEALILPLEEGDEGSDGKVGQEASGDGEQEASGDGEEPSAGGGPG